MAVSDWADEAAAWIERLQDRAGRLVEPSVRLGVTGLSRSGKTVFITSLVANLLERGRMIGLRAEAEGRIDAALLAPQPDLDAPRFDYERHLAALYGRPPQWPESTRSIAQLRVSIRYRGEGVLSRLTGDGFLHLDIVDYPGEWLLDLGLLPLSFAEWSDQALARASTREDELPEAGAFLAWAREVAPDAEYDEQNAQNGARAFTGYLRAAKTAGYAHLAPGRFLLPGDLEGAPALTFAPTPSVDGGFAREMARRFEAYKSLIAKPFFKQHFARLDRQVVLVDALGAATGGPERTRDMTDALTEILAAFRPGETSWLGQLLGWRRVDRLLLAVTKADHAHHTQHAALQELVGDMLKRTADAAAFKGALVSAIAIASLRATTETEIREGRELLPAVRGRLAETGEMARMFPGEPPRSLSQIENGRWDPEQFGAAAFAPPVLERRPGEGPPHLRLDKALEFLIGDRLT